MVGKAPAKRKVQYAIFRLSMPNCASWNGKWSGEGKRYVTARLLPANIDPELVEKLKSGYFYHNFGDGWGAAVSTEIVEGAAACNKATKGSDGFCGYDWMCGNILKYGKTEEPEDKAESV